MESKRYEVGQKALRDAARIGDPAARAGAVSQLMTQDQDLMTEAAKYRRQAIAEARESGRMLEQITAELGVTAGRIHVSSGHDVLIPQFLGRVAFILIVELEKLCEAAGADFVELASLNVGTDPTAHRAPGFARGHREDSPCRCTASRPPAEI